MMNPAQGSDLHPHRNTLIREGTWKIGIINEVRIDWADGVVLKLET